MLTVIVRSWQLVHQDSMDGKLDGRHSNAGSPPPRKKVYLVTLPEPTHHRTTQVFSEQLSINRFPADCGVREVNLDLADTASYRRT